MNIFIEKENETLNRDFEGSVEELLSELEINPEEVLVVCNLELLTLDDSLDNDCEVKILSVVSGG